MVAVYQVPVYQEYQEDHDQISDATYISDVVFIQLFQFEFSMLLDVASFEAAVLQHVGDSQLGFFILLHKVDEKPAGEDDYVFFNKAWTSLVKTTTMFVGELEFSDIAVNLDSHLAPLAYCFFLSFVFLIVVVLMNLLNGLAVSDTGTIREKAEIFSYRSQVETISTFESMLLGDPFDFLSNVPVLLSHLPSCSLLGQLYRSNTLKRFFTAFGATEILLFFPYKIITVRQNDNSEKFCCLGVDAVGRIIVAAAKEIVVKQQVGEEKDVLGKVEQLQVQVAGLEELIRQLVKKIDK